MKDDTNDPSAQPGRPVRLVPTLPGVWRLMLGIFIALLAPLFGILVGSSMSTQSSADGLEPLYWGFFIGAVIGVAALLVAGSGGLRLLRQLRNSDTEEHS